jgi:hypothetical protein
MANTYKNIVITPNTGSTTGDPTIVFSGGDSTNNTDIELVVYPTANGTLSFEGTAGQLFSITNDLSNTIFSVNDVSGLPLIEVNVASQQITLGQYYGNVGIGTAAGNSSNYKLDVAGGANISLPNLTVGGTNVIAAIVASNANAVTLSANVNVLAATFAAANANNISLSANVNVLAATFAAANANNISLSANVNTLAASFVSNSQTLSANVNTLAASFVSNSQTLSANVNTLAASFVSNSQTLSANVNTLAATFAAANANNISLSANVNLIAGLITNLTLENLPSAFVKRSVTAATTANIALYGTQTIDGVAVSAGNRVLVKDQTLANQNGLYVVSATAWARSADADVIGDIASAMVAVDAGTTNGGKLYDTNIKITDTLNTTSIVWNRIIDDGAIYTYAAPVTAYGALNVAYIAANTNAISLSANVNTLAATFAAANANNISLSANVNTLAATFAAANANNISLSANVNVLAATFAAANANNISLSANVNVLAATFAAANANNISLSANVNTLAASFVSNSQTLSANVNVLAGNKLSNVSGTSFNGNFFVPAGNVGIGTASPIFRLQILKTGPASATADIGTGDGNKFLYLNSNTSPGSYNGMVQANDVSIIYGVTNGADVSPSGMVIAPWSGSNRGIRIDNGGNVGIGKPIPTAPLHVAHATTNPLAVLESTGTQDIALWFTRSGTAKWYVYNDNASNGLNFGINGGLNPALKITSAGVAMFSAAANTTSLGVGTAASGVTGEIRATNNITAYYSSDKSLKENIKRIENAIKKIMSISGVEFDWTQEFIDAHGGEDGYFVRKHDVGVIAQDIEKVLPEVVATKQDGTKAVKYDRIVALLIEAIKDQQEQIDELKRLKSNN